MDIGFLRMMPNMALISPANGIELKGALKFAAQSTCPAAIRYPKDYVDNDTCADIFSRPFEMGKSVILRQGRDKLVLAAYGSMAIEALKAAQALTSDNIDITVINARFAKPIDEKIISLLAAGLCIINIEDHAAAGGFGSAILEAAAKAGLNTAKITVLGVDDKFIQADKRTEQLKQCGMSAQKIVEAVRKIVNAG
jgi:1-deoxy-D-xylulose-5-phosphate synthase